MLKEKTTLFEKNKKTVDIQCSMCYSIQVVVEKEKTI